MAKINCKRILSLRLNKLDSKGQLMLTNGLAKEVGLCFESVRRMETDPEYNPGVLTMNEVAEYFNVSIDSLIIK